MLLVVLIPGIGKEVQRQPALALAGDVQNLQPSELMKLLVVLYAADTRCARRR